MTIKTFTLGEVLSVTLRRMMVLEHEKMYTVVRHMLGRPIFTHELVDAYHACTPHILALHPQLAVLDRDTVTADNFGAWMSEKLERFGNAFELHQLPEGSFDRDPFDGMDMVVVRP